MGATKEDGAGFGGGTGTGVDRVNILISVLIGGGGGFARDIWLSGLDPAVAPAVVDSGLPACCARRRATPPMNPEPLMLCGGCIGGDRGSRSW